MNLSPTCKLLKKNWKLFTHDASNTHWKTPGKNYWYQINHIVWCDVYIPLRPLHSYKKNKDWLQLILGKLYVVPRVKDIYTVHNYDCRPTRLSHYSIRSNLIDSAMFKHYCLKTKIYCKMQINRHHSHQILLLAKQRLTRNIIRLDNRRVYDGSDGIRMQYPMRRQCWCGVYSCLWCPIPNWAMWNLHRPICSNSL